MKLSITLCKSCESIVSYMGIPTLWENCPDFTHKQSSHFRRSYNLIQSSEIKDNFSVIHRIVPDIVYLGI